MTSLFHIFKELTICRDHDNLKRKTKKLTDGRKEGEKNQPITPYNKRGDRGTDKNLYTGVSGKLFPLSGQ